MRIFIAFVMLLPLTLHAQSTSKPVDSTRYYRKQLFELQKRTFDSLKRTEQYQRLLEKAREHVSTSDAYNSFNVFINILRADCDAFNTSVAANGFTPFNKVIPQFGFGFTFKGKNRLVWDVAYFAKGNSNKSKNNDDKIVASLTNALLIDVGYDFVRSSSVNIYPYGGIGVRVASLRYSTPAIVNNTPDNITNIVQNNRSTSGEQFRLCYQAGIGFDFVIKNSSDHTSGTIFFVKAGTNGIVGSTAYNIEGVSYNPHIKYGAWMISAGLKFFGRK